MPNHTETILTVTGPDAKIQEFVDHCIVEVESKDFEDKVIVDAETGKPVMKQVFDFEKIIPMPKSMHITSGSTTSDAIALIKAEQGDFSDVDRMTNYIWVREKLGIGEDEEVPMDDGRAFVMKHLQEKVTAEHRKEGQMALDNVEQYGVQDWYSWSIQNWGTKWGAYDYHEISRKDGEFVCGYNTAWSPATPIISKLGEMYPELTFVNCYIDEGWGYYGRHTVCGKDDIDEEADGNCNGQDFVDFANEEMGYDLRVCKNCQEAYNPDWSEDGHNEELCYSCNEAEETVEEAGEKAE